MKAVGTEAAKILQRCTVLVLTAHYLGNHRKVKTARVAASAAGVREDELVDAVDTEQFSTTKRLVESETLTPATRIIGRAKHYLRSKGIPAHRVFGQRSYLIPLAALTEVDAKLTELEADLRAEATTVADGYAAAQERQREKLGDLYNAAEYPTPAQVEAAFGIDWVYANFESPDNLETVDRAIAASSQRKHEARMADAFAEVKLTLRVMLQEIVTGLIDKLTPGEDLKPRVIRGTMLKDLSEFVSSLSVRNVTDDAEIVVVGERLKQLANGVDLDSLRGDEGAAARDRLRAQLQTALGDVDHLVTTAKRGISFGSLSDVA